MFADSFNIFIITTSKNEFAKETFKNVLTVPRQNLMACLRQTTIETCGKSTFIFTIALLL